MVPKRAMAVAAALVVALLVGACAVGWRGYLAAEFPGSTLAGSETLVRYAPSLAVKRTMTYRTDAPFNEVYTWYSQRFSLGPEAHAQGGCILMARSFTSLWVVRDQITVTVCGTPNGQMMFVSRSSVVPYRGLLGW